MKRLLAGLSGSGLVLAALVLPLLAVQAATSNLIGNPSVEAASGTTPAGWSQGGWGTNTPTYTYANTGQDGSHSLKLSISGYTDGDAKWYFAPVGVTPGTAYAYSDYYQATVPTEIDAQVEDSAGNLTYDYVGSVPAATAWTKASFNWTAPAGAKNVTMFHVLAANGTLSTDNFSLTGPGSTTPTPSATPSTTPSSTPSPSKTPTPSATPSATPTPTPSKTPSPTPTPSPSKTPSPTPSPTPTPSPSPAPGNTVPNPGLETASGTTPASWNADSWGTNTAKFNYLTSGHTGSKSVSVTVSGFKTGSADWDYAPQPVKPGTVYQFTDYYKSGAQTEVDAAFTMSDGTTQYSYLGAVMPATNWTQYKAQVTAPAGAVSATVFHLIAANGTLTTDDYTFAPYIPAAYSRGLVSVTYDDGWRNQYTDAFPIMKKYGLAGTYYIISGELTDQPDYMSVAEIKALKASGSEIASHSVTHPDFTTLTAAQVTNEFKNSQSTLVSNFGGSISDFAYPYGAYNASTIATGSKYYQTQRSVEEGYNTKDNTVLTDLKVQDVYDTTTPAVVQGWINQAVKDHSWLILVYHEVGNTPIAADDAQYTTKPSDLDAEMAAVKKSGLGVVTINQAVNEVLPQIGK